MKLEEQCISLELAKKLKDLGVKHESYFLYAEYNDADDKHIVEIVKNPGSYSATFTSAFTVAELGEMLPKGIEHTIDEYPKKLWYLECDWIGGKARCDYIADDGQRIMEWTPKPKQNEADTEADARAKMLIYLREHNLITIK